MGNALHNIICLEAEWEYRNDKRNNKFSLNTEPLVMLPSFLSLGIVQTSLSSALA